MRGQQAADRAVRPRLRTPGHPKFQRPVERAFWIEIAKGLLPIEAAAVVGVSQPVGQRYRASVAQWKADLAARRPKIAKLVANLQLHAYVQERLSGQIHRPDGTVVAGPPAPRFTGNNKPHRKDRAWTWAWSPEQISHRLRIEFPDYESMRSSHEACGHGIESRALKCAVASGTMGYTPSVLRATAREAPS